MIEQLYHSNNPLFASFSPLHLLLLFLPIVLITLMMMHQTWLKTSAHAKWVKFSILGLMMGQQILLYSWYYFTGNFDPVDALPLYPCRISSLMCLFLLFVWKEELFHLLFFMGLPGATIALLLPDTWNLGFPNAMCIQFFMGHSGILLSIFYLVIVHDYNPNLKALFKSYKFTLVYLAALIPINSLLHSNYAYMAKKPDIAVLSFLPDFPMHIPLFIGFMFFMYFLVYLVWPKNVKSEDPVATI